MKAAVRRWLAYAMLTCVPVLGGCSIVGELASAALPQTSKAIEPASLQDVALALAADIEQLVEYIGGIVVGLGF